MSSLRRRDESDHDEVAVLNGGAIGEETAEEPEQTELMKYDAMLAAIRQCVDADELRDIRDRYALRQHAARMLKNRQAEDNCFRIRLRAFRKFGELLRESDRNA